MTGASNERIAADRADDRDEETEIRGDRDAVFEGRRSIRVSIGGTDYLLRVTGFGKPLLTR